MIKWNIDMIPHSGYILCYYKDDYIFEPYTIRDNKIDCINGNRLYRQLPDECHFFDSVCDYHLVKRESRGDVIENLSTAEEEKKMDRDLIYSEDVLLKEEYSVHSEYPKKLKITSRYRYSENDTLVLDSLRISTVD